MFVYLVNNAISLYLRQAKHPHSSGVKSKVLGRQMSPDGKSPREANVPGRQKSQEAKVPGGKCPGRENSPLLREGKRAKEAKVPGGKIPSRQKSLGLTFMDICGLVYLCIAFSGRIP